MNKIFLISLLLLNFNLLKAEDLGLSVSGAEVENILDSYKGNSETPYINANEANSLENLTIKETSPNLPGQQKEELDLTGKSKHDFSDIGYTTPGTFEKQDSYIEIDKQDYATKVSREGSSSFNIIYISDNYNYQSPNDVINRTIGTGYKHIKAGLLSLRNDKFFLKTSVFHFHWSVGAGLSYNYGRGIFVNETTQSEAGLRLWEIPLDFGLGLNFNASKYIKLSATAGPSVMFLIQNRDDLTKHETGKNKLQTGLGFFLSTQAKINLYSFAGESAYELFTQNQITNSYLTLEARVHSYQQFLDAIEISGVSFGAGVTFEFL